MIQQNPTFLLTCAALTFLIWARLQVPARPLLRIGHHRPVAQADVLGRRRFCWIIPRVNGARRIIPGRRDFGRPMIQQNPTFLLTCAALTFLIWARLQVPARPLLRIGHHRPVAQADVLGRRRFCWIIPLVNSARRIIPGRRDFGRPMIQQNPTFLLACAVPTFLIWARLQDTAHPLAEDRTSPACRSN